MDALTIDLRRRAHAVLRDALEDADPQVRITAAVAVLELKSDEIDEPGSTDARADEAQGLAPRERVDALASDLADCVPMTDLFDRHARAQLRARLLDEPPPPALRLGQLEVRGRLGAGGMGTVHRAYDERLDREVAIKLLRADVGDAPAMSRALLEEARAMARVSHPNLVQVFEVGQHEGQSYLVMELVAGTTLRQWTRDGQRTTREQLARWLDVACALQALHAAGLVHRDVKPDNVMVGTDGRCRLVDFGLAVPTHGTDHGALAGTPGYAAPELHHGRVTTAADVYALCVGLHESLLGHRPAHPLAPGQTLDPSPCVPAPLGRLLARGLCSHPELRPTMTELVDALRTALAPASSQPRPQVA